MRRIGPGADRGQALLELIDIAAHGRKVVHPAAQAFIRETRVGVRECLGKSQHKPAVAFRAGLSEVRQARKVPQAADFPLARYIRADGAVLAHPAQHPFIQRARIMDQHRIAGRALQRADQGFQARIVERRIAPLDRIDRIEPVSFYCFPLFILERRAAARLAKFAIGPEAAGAACNLRAFGERKRAVSASIIFCARGKHDAGDIQVEAHADRVGGDDVIDFARLVERDLRIARPRAERAHDDRRAALLPAEEFGDRVHFLGAEGDDGGAFRQLGDLRMARIAQLGKARPRFGLDPELERLQQRAHRIGAEQKGLVVAAHVQDTVREDVPAVIIFGELDFVDGDKVRPHIGRHRFRSADEIARRRRTDAFFAGQQRGIGVALRGHHPVVHFARQQAQRQADHARAVREHSLDRIVGLAGIGGAENGLQRGHGCWKG